MHLSSFAVAALLAVLFAGSPPAGYQPAAGYGTSAVGQPEPVAYEAEVRPKPPPKHDRKKNNYTKSNSPQWKSFQPYRDDIKTNGKSGRDRRYYTWDHRHNEIEEWDHNGEHLGSMDPGTGERIKPGKRDRNIKKRIK